MRLPVQTHLPRRQALLFLIAILVPCGVLVALALRIMEQERQLETFHTPTGATGSLMVRDLTSGQSRVLSQGAWAPAEAYAFAEDAVMSRDGKQAAFTWFTIQDRYHVRTVDARASSASPRVAYTELFTVRLTGGEPQKAGISLNGRSDFPRMHPDGRRIVF